jgi:hypothetical protein
MKEIENPNQENFRHAHAIISVVRLKLAQIRTARISRRGEE